MRAMKYFVPEEQRLSVGDTSSVPGRQLSSKATAVTSDRLHVIAATPLSSGETLEYPTVNRIQFKSGEMSLHTICLR